MVPSYEYTAEQITQIKGIREQIMQSVSLHHDQKKIVSFFGYVCLLAVDIEKHVCTIGVSNEFILTQIKKFFSPSILEAIHQIVDNHATIEYVMYAPLQKKNHPLTLSSAKLQGKATKEPRPSSSSVAIATPIAPAVAVPSVMEGSIVIKAEYTFDSLIVGANNEFAVSAAKAVADKPGRIYSPLFLYGGVGLGKTHLLQAIGNEIYAQHPQQKIIYMPATSLVDGMVHAIRRNKLTQFKAQFCQGDVLLIDDIQFLAGKEKTQEVFLDIFNDYIAHDKQIVITSDMAPKDIANMEARLQSRFSKGLVIDIQTPDYETRLAILQEKCRLKGEMIDFDLLTIIAHNIDSNVRELEGALNIILTKKKLTGSDITEESMIDCLSTLGYAPRRQSAQSQERSILSTRGMVSFAKLVDFVGVYYNISLNDLKSAKRTKDITNARQLLMSIAKEQFHWTLEKIGDYFGGKHHASVIYACNNFHKKRKSDSTLEHDYNIFLDKLS